LRLNRNLLLFSLFLVVVGAVFDFYIVSLFGVLLLVPALLQPSRTRASPAPGQPRQDVRRVTPAKPQSGAQPAQMAPQPSASEPPPQQLNASQSYSYSPALFPRAIFPSLSLQGSPMQQTALPPEGRPAERDDLIEAGVILALARLILG
jgi:hypothetical protein